MLTFILRRFFSSLVVLFVVVSLTLPLSIAQKGGPFEKEKMTEDAKAKKEIKYEVDGPIWWIVARYEKHLFFEGDMRMSLKYLDRSVLEILAQKMPNSLVLGAAAFVIASLGGVALGFFAAMKRDTIFDFSSMLLALGAISIPTFVTGPLLIAVFGLWLGWLPIGGFGSFNQVIMPAICLALPFLAYVARLMRNSLLDVTSQNFMRTAKAKGLDNATAMARHALKVAILPVITYLGPMAAYVLTGSFVVETVFNISGVGLVFVNAIQNRDFFLLTGAVIVYSALIVFFNFIVDVTYTFLDKRIKLDG
jgi:oligopeptide transport system permease protein